VSATDQAALVMVLLGFGTLAAVAAWARSARRIWAPAAVLLLAAALVVASPRGAHAGPGAATALLVALAGALAVAGGGPVTALVFELVDRREPADGPEQPDQPADRPDQPADRWDHRQLTHDLAGAGRVLRGGAWIGVLERLAVVGTLVAGWPEGLAVVLAVKGLGRYPELRAAEDGARSGAAERFIIGTFTSVLWACACATVVVLVRP
jgi:hypothetical protein